jgi:hypothetical protein
MGPVGLMDYREEADVWDPRDFPRTDGYMAKRIGAYLADLGVAAILIILAFYLLGADLNESMIWLYIVILIGVLSFLLKAVLEAGIGRSIGKIIFGLLVISPYGEASFGQALARNISNIVPLVGPLFDLIFGRGSAVDDRQKFSDTGAETLVIEDLPIPVEEPVRIYRPPVKVEPPKPKEKVRLDYRKMRVGHCPRCGAPYRVLPPDDPSFSGLWNHRCTWCNHRITEDERS